MAANYSGRIIDLYYILRNIVISFVLTLLVFKRMTIFYHWTLFLRQQSLFQTKETFKQYLLNSYNAELVFV